MRDSRLDFSREGRHFRHERLERSSQRLDRIILFEKVERPQDIRLGFIAFGLRRDNGLGESFGVVRAEANRFTRREALHTNRGRDDGNSIEESFDRFTFHAGAE